MITEDYVSFEVAKLLKEKGFNEKVGTYYLVHPNGFPEFFDKKDEFSSPEDVWLKCPTLQMAMKWLREVHGLFISIGNDDLDYNWQIIDIKNRTKDLDPTCLTDSYVGYRKYGLACEVAIKYCLKNLIK